jgi:hypothetical protein
MVLTVMYFGMGAELLVHCQRLGASLAMASIWFFCQEVHVQSRYALAIGDA